MKGASERRSVGGLEDWLYILIVSDDEWDSNSSTEIRKQLFICLKLLSQTHESLS